MQSISAWVHFLSLAFLEALSVTNVTLLYWVGSCSLYPWQHLVSEAVSQQLLPAGWRGAEVARLKECGLISPGVWQEGEKKQLIGNDSKLTSLGKMSSLYLSFWKQDPFPRRWCQEEAKTSLLQKEDLVPPMLSLQTCSSGCLADEVC